MAQSAECGKASTPRAGVSADGCISQYADCTYRWTECCCSLVLFSHISKKNLMLSR